MVSPVSRFAFDDLQLGQQAAFEATVSEADLDRFAEVSGDASPLHMDAGFARARGFAGRVTHGAYLTALVSRLVGVHLPGESRSEEHTSELQSLMRISYAVFCL